MVIVNSVRLTIYFWKVFFQEYAKMKSYLVYFDAKNVHSHNYAKLNKLNQRIFTYMLRCLG